GLPYVNLARVHWLLPALWSLALGFALLRLLPRRWGRTLALLLCLGQAALAAAHHQAVIEAGRSGLTYRQFYAEALFARIKADLGAEAEARVASLGLHPAVAQYNGFHTLDGYFNAYPLAYKHAFRPVIAPALAADPVLRRYFDDWGSRLYLFNSAL